jgi:DNA-binding NarL/FixJ family response regulator
MIGVVEGDGGRASVVAEADNLVAALLAVKEERADAVVLDLRMPTVDGLRTVRHLRRAFPDLAIVVCSFDLEARTIRQAVTDGADACLCKPVSPHELVDVLDAARRSPAESPEVLVGAAAPGAEARPV